MCGRRPRSASMPGRGVRNAAGATAAGATHPTLSRYITARTLIVHGNRDPFSPLGIRSRGSTPFPELTYFLTANTLASTESFPRNTTTL